MSWDVIIPFLKPIEPFLKDPEVSDILVNGSDRVFVEKHGVMREVPGVHISEKALMIAVRNIARVLGDDVSAENPLLDARLPDGSRVAAVLAPCSVTGTILAIRKFQSRPYTIDELVRTETLTSEMAACLRRAVEDRQNILISGGAGTGKTTLLNALAAFIPPEERLIVIEDTAEIQIQAPNLVRLEARREQPGVPAITMGQLLKASLRLRPDRILLGEIRLGEAFDLLQTLNTGHSGTISTLHANSAADSLTRFTTCVLTSGIELPYKALRSNIADALNLLVHIKRRRGKRLVTQVSTVRHYDPALDRYDLDCLFERSA